MGPVRVELVEVAGWSGISCSHFDVYELRDAIFPALETVLSNPRDSNLWQPTIAAPTPLRGLVHPEVNFPVLPARRVPTRDTGRPTFPPRRLFQGLRQQLLRV